MQLHVIGNAMKLTIILGLMLIAGEARDTPSNGVIQTSCFRGSIGEEDLSQGELLLNDEDLVKVRLSDQQAMSLRSEGKSHFPASREDLSKYQLREESNWHWTVAVAGGLFGRTFEDAQENFQNNAPVYASYYPSTKKVVVFSNLPSAEGDQAFGFFVFVHVPNEARIITYDCGAFE
jgi:hypothetical protein